MRILITDCEIYYSGRGKSYLSRGERLILIKDDNTVMIHQYKGLKPINYMKEAINIEMVEIPEKCLIVQGKKEKLEIIIHNIIKDDVIGQMNDNANIQREDTELHLHNWLAKRKNFVATFSDDAKYLDQEFDTSKGACDLIGIKNNKLMLIEMKRTAYRNDVYQVKRYIDGVNDMYNEMFNKNVDFITTRTGKKISIESLKQPYAYLVANTIKPGVKDYANKYNIKVIELNK